MKKIKQLLKNATNSIATTLMGAIIGVPEIIEGVHENNTSKIITGIATFLLGIFSNEKND